MIIKYGKQRIEIPLNKEKPKVIEPDIDPCLNDPKQSLLDALNHPAGSVPLCEHITPGSTIAILLPDMTRKAGIRELLPTLLSYLNKHGADRNRITFITALGIHRRMTRPEMAATYGEIISGYTCVNHQAHDPTALTHLGKTSRGTPIEINRIAAESDRIISLSRTSFHYNAGAGGGRKMFLPGIASARACMANHRLVLTGKPYPEEWRDPRACTNRLQGNPVHEDMLEFIAAVPVPIFSISILPAPGNGFLDITAGDIREAHNQSVTALRSNFEYKLSSAFDTVIASCGGYPYDIDMIQSHKGLDAAVRAAKKGGTVILFTECSGGMGHDDFFPWFSPDGLGPMTDRLNQDYKIYGQTACAVREKAEKCTIYIKTELSNDNVRAMGMNPFQNITDLPQGLFTKKTAVLPHASILAVTAVNGLNAVKSGDGSEE